MFNSTDSVTLMKLNQLENGLDNFYIELYIMKRLDLTHF